MTIEKISTWQATTLLTMGILPTAIMFPPSIIVKEAGRDAWLSFIISGILGLLSIFIIVALSSRYRDSSFLQITERVFGKLPGKVIIMLYSFFFIILTAIVLREFSAFMVISFYKNTPLEVLTIIMLLLTLYGVYLGLEVISRVSETVFIFVIAFLLFFIVLGIRYIDFSEMLPLLDEGIGSVLRGSFVFFVWTGEIFFLGMIMPHINRPSRASIIGAITIGIVTFFMAVNDIILESIYGYNLYQKIIFPLLSYVRYVGIAGFWERTEAFIILIWIAGLYVKLSFFTYLSAVSIKELTGMSRYQDFLLPLGVILLVISITMFENTLELSNFITTSWSIFAPLFVFVIPLLTLITSCLRPQSCK